MKSVGKALLYGLIFALFIAVLALITVVRLAPSDPARWNVPVADGSTPNPGPCADQIRQVPKGARATCVLPGSPSEVLIRLDAISLATPRTQFLVGSAADGRITWISRSKIMGYPDYITAETKHLGEGTQLDIFSRQRYGNGDFGVNAARLKVWLTTLDQG